jgi:predicted NBD/HSP70 family sugar kinase
MLKKGKNLQDVKMGNRMLVLKLICTGQCSSRADISRKTGLSKMTVTNIVQQLLQEDLVCEGEDAVTKTVGRKGISLHPNEQSKKSIGVYISRDGITLSLLSLSARIICTHNVPIVQNDTSETLLQKIISGVEDIVKHENRNGILGIGISCIGPLDSENGILLSPTDFYGIENVPLKSALENATMLPVAVNNDMNAAALAELLYGYGTGNDHFIYFGITHGVGAGIVVNGRLYTGAEGYGGEIGHVCINYDGPLCFCGSRGCLEVYASMPVFLKKVRREAEKIQHMEILSIENLRFSDLVHLAKTGDRFALAHMEALCFAVSTALVSAIHLLNSSTVFIGHESAQGGEWFARKIEEQINSRSLFHKNITTEVRISKFGEHSSVAGSGILVFDRYFQGLL